MKTPKPISFEEWKKRNPDIFENDKICPDCSGSGTIECPTCWGEDDDCKRCVGGEIICDFCNGTGSLNPPLKQYYHKVRKCRHMWQEAINEAKKGGSSPPGLRQRTGDEPEV